MKAVYKLSDGILKDDMEKQETKDRKKYGK